MVMRFACSHARRPGRATIAIAMNATDRTTATDPFLDVQAPEASSAAPSSTSSAQAPSSDSPTVVTRWAPRLPSRSAVVSATPRYMALGAILALSAILNTHRLAQNGYANTFYSAGVQSMLKSWHNFFFVSFDPAGLVTIDKPPLGIWVQVASAKAFGFSPLSLLLPEAILSTLAVAVLYRAIARPFGWPAALGGALALAIFPSFVAVSRDNGVDPLLILLMILACGAALRSIEDGRWRWLLACAVLIGLAFNTKTLAAYLIVPGIALAYFVCAPGSWLRRVGMLSAAAIVMVVCSFASRGPRWSKRPQPPSAPTWGAPRTTPSSTSPSATTASAASKDRSEGPVRSSSTSAPSRPSPPRVRTHRVLRANTHRRAEKHPPQPDSARRTLRQPHAFRRRGRAAAPLPLRPRRTGGLDAAVRARRPDRARPLSILWPPRGTATPGGPPPPARTAPTRPGARRRTAWASDGLLAADSAPEGLLATASSAPAGLTTADTPLNGLTPAAATPDVCRPTRHAHSLTAADGYGGRPPRSRVPTCRPRLRLALRAHPARPAHRRAVRARRLVPRRGRPVELLQGHRAPLLRLRPRPRRRRDDRRRRGRLRALRARPRLARRAAAARRRRDRHGAARAAAPRTLRPLAAAGADRRHRSRRARAAGRAPPRGPRDGARARRAARRPHSVCDHDLVGPRRGHLPRRRAARGRRPRALRDHPPRRAKSTAT